ncbi:MAG: hypothetical protein JSV30_02920 [Candidatus Omnitrophota bacterium]|nr:MAG: hypothetical protein JSV30_02920 [Candidatus Omnitrophota bacterium]
MLRRLMFLILAVSLLYGCNEKEEASLTINPTSGPTETKVTLSFRNLEPHAPIAIMQDSVVGVSSTKADGNGNADVVEIVIGEPGQVVTITAETGSTGYEATLTAKFRITN